MELAELFTLESLAIVGTLILLEAVLSFDNAAILAAMVRKLPHADRRKALLYGLAGAYVLRVAAILLASFLIETPELKIVGGLYLFSIGVKHFYRMARRKPGSQHAPELKTGLFVRLGVPSLVATIIQIELVDLAFAIDQVIVAVAFTDKILLVVLASIAGLMFLRLAATMIARVMDWLPPLEHLAYVAVSYVGIKLVLLYPFPFINEGRGVHVPTPVSVGITLSLFLVPVLVKLIFGVPRSNTPAEGEGATVAPPTKPDGPSGPA